jgi:hypothetical protein
MNVYRSFGFDSIKQGIYWLGNNWEKILAFSTQIDNENIFLVKTN